MPPARLCLTTMDEHPIPAKIVVELLSSADVKRLEARDDDLRQEIKKNLENRIEGLHRHIYELMEAISKLRSKRS